MLILCPTKTTSSLEGSTKKITLKYDLHCILHAVRKITNIHYYLMKSHVSHLLSFFGFYVVVVLVSCTKTTKTEPDASDKYSDYIVIDEIEMSNHNYTVRLYAEIVPHVGYNNFAVKIFEKGTSTPVEGAQVTYWPTFKTATATYSSYVEQSYNPQYKYMHHGGVVFTSQAKASDSCTLSILVREPGKTVTDTVTFELSLKEPLNNRVFEFIYEEEPLVYKTYFVTLINPIRPIEGNNSYEFLLTKREGPALVVPISTFTVFSSVTKPSSASGQSRFLTRVTIPPGHYIGKINFDEIGEWSVSLRISASQNKFYYDKVKFDFTVGK